MQHIHPSFARSFAQWLESSARRPVRVAEGGERLHPGGIFVSPGDRHLALAPDRTVRLDDEPLSLHRPSADVLFESLARAAGRDAVGVVLTGMGADGSRGLAALRAAGGRVFAQDEASSVVFGMPQAAIRAGAVDQVVALDGMAAAICAALEVG